MHSRVFLAIELSPATRDLVAATGVALAATDPPWVGEKSVAAGLLHVTLLFIGAVPEAHLPDLLLHVRASAARTPPFRLRISGIRAIPDPRRASMVWATLDGEVQSAASLAADLRRAAGLPVPDGPFRLHITLVRARHPRSLRADAITRATAVLSDSGRDPDRFVSVRFVTVFSSKLRSDGPEYRSLARYELGTAVG